MCNFLNNKSSRKKKTWLKGLLHGSERLSGKKGEGLVFKKNTAQMVKTCVVTMVSDMEYFERGHFERGAL